MPDVIVSEFSLQLCQLLEQATAKIEHCLEQLSDEQIWWRPDPEMNSIGNLLLHISGNLRQWCVTLLTGTPDVRDRDSEFSTTFLDQEKLMTIVQSTVSEAKHAISKLRRDQLLNMVAVQGFQVTTMNALLHTTTHFQGHTHQIILLTRMQKKTDYKLHWNKDSRRDRVPM